MNKIKTKFFILFAFLSSIISTLFIEIGYKSIGKTCNLTVYFFVFAGINLFLFLLQRFKYLYLVALIFAIVLIKYKLFSIILISKQIIPFYKSLVENQGITNEFFNIYILLFFVVTILLSVLSFYFTFIKRQTIYLLILGVAFFSFYDFFGIDTFKKSNIFLITWVYLFWLSRNFDVEENKNHEKNYSYKVLALFTIFILITNLAIKILPNNKEGKGSKLIEFAQEMNEKINKKEQVTVTFDLKTTGFQPNSNKLGGPIKLNHEKALTVYPNNYSGELYLRGVIKDFYDGHKWKKTENNFVSGSRVNYNREGIRKYEIQIRPTNLVTYTAFNVLFPEMIRNRWNDFLIDTDYLETKHPHLAKGSDKYYVEFASYDYSVYNNYFQNKNWPTYNFKEDGNYIDFLRIPYSDTSKVHNLTRLIIKNSKNDLEAAKRIQDYLRNNYTYDLKPSTTPDNADFVEHFLFVEKKGYCVYYASAMVIMCRAAGIPARYVEGFAVNATPYKEIDVLNSNAHAWAEVYINGLGFVTFDPTPGHYTTVDYAFDVLKNQSDIKDENNQIERKREKEITEENKSQEGIKNETSNNWMTLIILILLIIIVLSLAKRKDKKVDYYISKLKFFSFALEGRYVGFTLEEIMNTIGEKLECETSRPLEILNTELYGNGKLTLGDKKVLDETFKVITKSFIKNWGLNKYIYKKLSFNGLMFKIKILGFIRSKKV